MPLLDFEHPLDILNNKTSMTAPKDCYLWCAVQNADGSSGTSVTVSINNVVIGQFRIEYTALNCCVKVKQGDVISMSVKGYTNSPVELLDERL